MNAQADRTARFSYSAGWQARVSFPLKATPQTLNPPKLSPYKPSTLNLNHILKPKPESKYWSPLTSHLAHYNWQTII